MKAHDSRFECSCFIAIYLKCCLTFYFSLLIARLSLLSQQITQRKAKSKRKKLTQLYNSILLEGPTRKISCGNSSKMVRKKAVVHRNNLKQNQMTGRENLTKVVNPFKRKTANDNKHRDGFPSWNCKSRCFKGFIITQNWLMNVLFHLLDSREEIRTSPYGRMQKSRSTGQLKLVGIKNVKDKK